MITSLLERRARQRSTQESTADLQRSTSLASGEDPGKDSERREWVLTAETRRERWEGSARGRSGRGSRRREERSRGLRRGSSMPSKYDFAMAMAVAVAGEREGESSPAAE